MNIPCQGYEPSSIVIEEKTAYLIDKRGNLCKIDLDKLSII